MHPTTRIHQTLSTSESVNAANSPQAQRAIARSPSASKNCPHQAVRNELAIKKEQEKDANGQKHGESEVKKGRANAKQNARAGQSGTTSVRKDVKDIGIGTVSGMRHLAVGVAS